MFSVTIHIPSLVPDPSARHVEPQLMRSLRELPQLRFAAQPLVQQREVQPTVALRFGAGEVEVWTNSCSEYVPPQFFYIYIYIIWKHIQIWYWSDLVFHKYNRYF